MANKQPQRPKRVPIKAPRTGGVGGRPPSGPSGERVSQYPTLTVRLPQATKDALTSLSALRRVPMWKLLDMTVRAYIDTLPADERRLLTQFTAKMDRGMEPPTHGGTHGT
jgi:hypothetical protein